VSTNTRTILSEDACQKFVAANGEMYPDGVDIEKLPNDWWRVSPKQKTARQSHKESPRKEPAGAEIDAGVAKALAHGRILAAIQELPDNANSTAGKNDIFTRLIGVRLMLSEQEQASLLAALGQKLAGNPSVEELRKELDAAWRPRPHKTADPELILKSGRPGRFPSIGPLEVMAMPPPKWLVKGFLERAETCFLYGEYGLGKSFLALAFAITAAFGRPFMGLRTTKCKIVYLCAESFGGFSVRLQAFEKQHPDMKLADVQKDLRFIYNVPDVCKLEDVADLIADLQALGPLDVVILDTWARVTAGSNENAVEDMGVALKNCQTISRATGALVMAVAHPGKDPSKGLRGSSAVPSGADTLIEIVELDGGVRQARVRKQRNGVEGPVFCFELTKIPLGCDSDGDEISSCVVEQRGADTVRAKRQLPASVPPERRYAYTRLRLAARGRIDIDELVEQLKQRLVRDPPGKKDRRSDRARRTIQWLIDNNFADLVGNEVSLPLECMPTPEEVKALAKEQAEAETAWEALNAAEAAGIAEAEQAAAPSVDPPLKSQKAPQRKTRKPRVKPAAASVVTEPEILKAPETGIPPLVAEPAPTVDNTWDDPPAKANGSGQDNVQTLMKQLRTTQERAEKLVNAGVTTPELVTQASIKTLTGISGHQAYAKTLQNEARKWLSAQRAGGNAR
jgi:AAA domain